MSTNARTVLGGVLVAAAGIAAYVFFSTGAAVEKEAGMGKYVPSAACRQPARAGLFYPGEPGKLSAQVRKFVEKSPPEARGVPIAVIAPHAGYEYSGQVAGTTYALLKARPISRAVVLAVSHFSGPHPVWVDDVAAYRMPWGDVPVDTEAISRLTQAGMPAVAGAARNEHSLEVQLPFLQEVLPQGWKLVPILVAAPDGSGVRKAVEALKTILDDSTVVCVSSDFTHYGDSYGYVPFAGSDEEVKASLAALDGEAAKVIVAKDAKGFGDYLQRTKATICGKHPIMILLELLPEWAKGRQVAYETSGEKTGDFKASVSYVGIVFEVSGREKELWRAGTGGQRAMGEPRMLTDAEKKTLLAIARATLEGELAGKKPDVSAFELTDTLKEKRGVFVTLTTHGELRGCIGYVKAVQPLCEAVRENALNAAFKDPRFNPLTAQEFKDLRIEISALSPFEKITDVSRIEVGKHGIMITRGHSSGLLLPQVATEYGWNREEFLVYTCRKAGLPNDAWKDPRSNIEIFSADVFHEQE